MLRAKRIRILKFAADAVFPRQVFRRYAHMVVVEGVPQPVMNKAVKQLTVPELRAGPAVGQDMRGAAHVFLPSGNDHVRFTALDGLRRKVERFQT